MSNVIKKFTVMFSTTGSAPFVINDSQLFSTLAKLFHIPTLVDVWVPYYNFSSAFGSNFAIASSVGRSTRSWGGAKEEGVDSATLKHFI